MSVRRWSGSGADGAFCLASANCFRTLAGWKGYRALRDDALEARTGKTMINLLMKTKKGRSMLTRLAELSPNIACLPQAVTVLGAYRVRKDDLGWLKPDGSNLSEALEPIVVSS